VNPWDALAIRVVAVMPNANVIAGPAPAVEPDAIVIRPDEPWLVHTDGRFTTRPERYAAIAASRVADPASSLAALYLMVGAILLAASDEGWDWESVSGITLDETTGVPLLVVTAHVTYQVPKGG
jgi:hypothetical protein